jgi:hypothetical protein
MPAPIKPEIVNLVEDEWAITPDISARAVSRRFLRKYGNNLVRERLITRIIAAAKERAPKEPFPLTPWKPWVNEQESSEDTRFLLRMHAIKKAAQDQGLYEHEAKWGRRIRAAVEGFNSPYPQYRLVREYAEREVTAYYLRRDVNTEALDAWITYAPWLSLENQRRYELALASGLAQIPFHMSPKELKAVREAERKAEAAQTGEKKFRDFLPESDFLNLDDLDDLPEPTFLPYLAAHPELFPGWSSMFLEYLEYHEIPSLDLSSIGIPCVPEQQAVADYRKAIVKSWASPPEAQPVAEATEPPLAGQDPS